MRGRKGTGARAGFLLLWWFCFYYYYFIEVELTYSVALVSGVQHHDLASAAAVCHHTCDYTPPMTTELSEFKEPLPCTKHCGVGGEKDGGALRKLRG